MTLVISICVATLPMLWESARLFEFGPGRASQFSRVPQMAVANS